MHCLSALFLTGLLLLVCFAGSPVSAFWFWGGGSSPSSTSSASSSTSACGSPAIAPRLDNARIVGGNEAKPNSWPWQAALFRSNFQGKYSAICGGTLINKQWILTAAHCVAALRSSPSRFAVTLGMHKISDPAEATRKVYYVSKIIVHSSFSDVPNTPMEFDIALLKLSSSVLFNSYISPACLPAATEACPGNGTVGYVTGWGVTVSNGAQSPSLRQVSLPVVEMNSCNSQLTGAGGIKLDGQNFCAGYSAGGKDSCQGDSGGPFVVQSNGKWSVKGVVSWGFDCARPNFPGVYTCVAHFRNWIDTQIAFN